MPHRIHHYYRQNPLAFKVAGAVLLVSIMVMLISIGVFMVREYHQGMERLEQNLEQVELTALPGLSRSLWNFDEEQLRVQVNALLHLPDVASASVTWTDWNGHAKAIGSSMAAPPKALTIRELPLVYQRNDGTRETLGQLELGISHSSIYQYVGKQTAFLIGFLALQALVSAILIILLMRLLFTRRLSQLADDTRHLSLSSLRQPLPLPTNPEHHDELDNIAAALNTMRERLLQDINARRDADRALLQERQLRLDNEERRIHAESANDAKSTFMATMSHEIRTPLNGIIGIIDLMQNSTLSNQQAHYLR
ncbi:MAG: histidine kinase dimerization/phospho-acceptor domain-containing protein, partial [Alcanivorax sp.]